MPPAAPASAPRAGGHGAPVAPACPPPTRALQGAASTSPHWHRRHRIPGARQPQLLPATPPAVPAPPPRPRSSGAGRAGHRALLSSRSPAAAGPRAHCAGLRAPGERARPLGRSQGTVIAAALPRRRPPRCTYLRLPRQAAVPGLVGRQGALHHAAVPKVVVVTKNLEEREEQDGRESTASPVLSLLATCTLGLPMAPLPRGQ